MKGPASRTPQPACETPTPSVEGCMTTRSAGTINCLSGTGFSREEACVYTNHSAARRSTPSRLKPVPLKHRIHSVRAGWGLIEGPRDALVGPASAGKLLLCCCSAVALLLLFIRKRSRHRKTRLGCRLNAGLVEWAERHGCRESRPPPWMADGGGPTERDRSEGTLTKEGPNREQALLVTFSAF